MGNCTMQPIHDETFVDDKTDDFETLVDDEPNELEDFLCEETNELEIVVAEAEKTTQNTNPHAGHRERLKRRLDNGILGDAELLEWLLFSAIPRRNTSDVAHDLLAKFGSLHAVANAPEAELRKVHGVGDSVVRVLRGLKSFGERYARPNLSTPHSLASQNFWEVLHDAYLLEHREVFDVYLLTKENWVYKSVRFAVGTDTEAFINTSAIAYFLQKESPYAIIIVHNHPIAKEIDEKDKKRKEMEEVKKTEPSDDDEKTTNQFKTLCNVCGVLLYDHLIFGKQDWYSFLRSRQKQRIRVYYSLEDIIPKQGGL